MNGRSSTVPPVGQGQPRAFAGEGARTTLTCRSAERHGMGKPATAVPDILENNRVLQGRH